MTYAYGACLFDIYLFELYDISRISIEITITYQRVQLNGFCEKGHKGPSKLRPY